MRMIKKCICVLIITIMSIGFVASENSDTGALQKAFIDTYIAGKPSEKAYQNLKAVDSVAADTLKCQADAVAHIFTEVLKTEKQLVPKQCHYLAVYGYENAGNETLEKACNNLRLATLANMDRKTMKIYIAGSQRTASLFTEALRKTPMDAQRIIILPSGSIKEAARKIIAEVIKDNEAGHYDMDNLLYRRIMLFSAATNARIGYASFIAALGANAQHFILDDFSTLDISRKELDMPSHNERKAAFEALLQNHF